MRHRTTIPVKLAAARKVVGALKLHRLDIAWAAGVAVFTVAAVVWGLHLWEADLRVPLIYSGDNLGNLALIKGILQNGWYEVNPYLGAPLGLELYDYPSVAGDHLHILTIKALGIFSSDPAVVENTFFLLSFPMSAVSAYAVQRYYKISMPVAFVTSALFALTPDHFVRGEGHLFLATAWSIPLGCYLIVESFAGRALIVKRPRPGPRALSYASPRTIATLVISVVMGTTGTYYGVFTIVLVAVGVLVAAVGARRTAPLVSGAIVIAAIVVTFAANLAPTLIHHMKHGGNPTVGKREPFEADLYGLKLADMLLPVTNHRVPFLAEIRRKYDETRLPGPNRYFSEAGTAVTIGFIFLLLALLVTVVAPARAPGPPLLRNVAAASFVALLFGTIGAFSTILAYTISPQLRAWARISIVIVFFALVGLAILLEAGGRLLARRRHGQMIWTVALPILLVLAVLDTNNPPAVFSLYVSNKAAYASDSQFVGDIERQVGASASIFQLPYMSYPENGPVVNMPDYEPLRGYLHSATLRWSYPTMRGRPTDWASQLRTTPIRRLVPAVVAAGFRGIWVDRNGYADRGAKVETQLDRVVGPAAVASPDGAFVFFNLTGYARTMLAKHSPEQIAAARRATLYPVRIDFGNGFYPLDSVGKRQFHWGRTAATAELVNPAKAPQQAIFSTVVATTTKEPAAVTLRWPDGISQTVRASSSGTRVRRALVLRPGANTLEVSTRAPRAPNDPRDLHVALIDPTVRVPVFALGVR